MIFEELFNLQRNLENLFDRDLFQGTTFSRGLFPAINLFEKGDQIILKAEIPGMQKDDVRIEIHNDTVSLVGEKKRKGKDEVNYHRRERPWGTFRRQLALPFRVNPEKVAARLEDGVMTIEMEKAEEYKPRTITIK